MRSVRYAVDELILAVAADHPLAREAEVRFGAALAFDFVCMSRTSSNFLFLRDMAQRAGKSPNVRLHAHSFEAVLSLAEAGVGVALVPRSVAAAALREARVVGVRLAEPWALRELNLIVRATASCPALPRRSCSSCSMTRAWRPRARVARSRRPRPDNHAGNYRLRLRNVAM